MSATTSIEWTDKTWNPVRGCSRVSAGCDHCYAEGVAARFSGPGQPYAGLAKFVGRAPSAAGGSRKRSPHWTGKIKLVEDALTEPLHWRKPCRVFVNSMSDLFHGGVPMAFRDRVFATMALCPQHTFQILTKRPEEMRAYLSDPDAKARIGHLAGKWAAAAPVLGKPSQNPGVLTWPLPNVHLGVSVEDQAAADARIPLLLATPAAVRFISAEPLLGAVDLGKWLVPCNRCLNDGYFGDKSAPPACAACTGPALDWVIVGGESGAGARPMHPDWARSLRDQCVAAGVPFFFKQWGEWQNGSGKPRATVAVLNNGHVYADPDDVTPDDRENWARLRGTSMARVGKKRAGRMLDGREWSQFPGDELPSCKITPEGTRATESETRADLSTGAGGAGGTP